MATDSGKSLFHKQIQDICDQVGVSKPDAFPRWICRNILGITDEGTIDETVSIGGKNDYGVDIFHADDSGDVREQYVCCIQAKFSEDLDHKITREEIVSFANTFAHLRRCPDPANPIFKQKSAEFIQMETKNPQIKKKMIFVVAGKPNTQVQELITEQWKRETFGNDFNSVDFDILDLNEILSRMTTPHTPTLEIKFDGDVLTRIDENSNKESIIGYVNARDLVKISKEHREVLFLENPRQTLGKTAPTHKAILNTLNDPVMRKKFWKLNNGITAICSNFDGKDSTYNIDNFKIVNGRQTLYTLENSFGMIDDVFLLMTIHEAHDDKERNQITEATNTQNPIKPIDLITNYPEMIDLVSQCKENFNDFYFERQTKGFQSVNSSVKNRVTHRRIMEKSSVARAYYAYEIDPNDAILSDKILFSVTEKNSYYDKIFSERKIKEFIIPHIFLQMLTGLHRKWCREQRDNPSYKILRNKGIISKDIIKYYILRFIHESMVNIDDSTRQSIKDNLIKKFRKLGKKDKDPEIFLNIAQAAYEIFLLCFNTEKNETWPPELMEKLRDKNYQTKPHDEPTPYDVMNVLKQNGTNILPILLHTRKDLLTHVGDKIQNELLKLVE